MNRERDQRVLVWLTTVAGCAVMVYGARGLWTDAFGTRGADATRWFLAGGVAHDLVWSPVVLAAGWLTGRLPRAARAPVRLGLAFSVVLAAVAWPLVQGWGRQSTNPSALPLDYGRNLTLVLALIWCGVIVGITVRVRRGQ